MALTVRRLGFCPVTLRVLWTLAAAFLLYRLREVLVLLVISILTAYVLLPVVNLVDRYLKSGRRRTIALALVYVALVGVIIAIASTVGVYAGRQATALLARVKNMVSSGAGFQIPLPEFLKPYGDRILPEIGDYLKEHAQDIFQTLSGWTLRLLSGLSSLFELVVVLILSFFFLKDGAAMTRGFLAALPAPAQPRASLILDQVGKALATYVRSMVLVALASSTLYILGLTLLGVPYAVLLGVIAFPFEFIPMVGPLTSGSIMVLTALFSGYYGVLWIIIFLLAVRAIQDYGLQPLLLGGELELSPMALVVGVLAGAALGGIVGAMLSVPTLAVARILLLNLVLRDEADTA